MPRDTLKEHIGQNSRLKAIRENDEVVMKAFYQENYPKVETYVLNNSGSIDEAKDVYQEAFIAVWRNIQLDRFKEHAGTSLEGYLYQVAKHKWLDHLRMARRRQVVPLAVETNGFKMPELSENEQELLTLIKTKMKLLGEMCREVLDRFYYQKQSMRTISEGMNWTEATAKNNKYRCLQRLRELLKSNTPERE